MSQQFTDKIKGWIAVLKSRIVSRAPALDQFKGSVKSKYGTPERIRLTFPRHYIFREKGVGKGRKKGSGKETPKPDINTVLTEVLPQLADIAAEEAVEIAANRLFIK